MTHAQAKQIFATHMQAARKRKLAPMETKQLSQARQVLRMHARPAMNKPRKKSLETGDKSQAYRGYYIRYNHFDNTYYISKGDSHIASADSIEKAKQAIDMIANPKRKAKSNPGKPVLIYGNVTRILATKTQGHICDDECKKAGHRYFHDFKSKPKMYGLPDGSLLIKH